MKKIAFSLLLLVALSAANCTSGKKTAADAAKEKTVTVTGEVQEVQRGKDGFTATITSGDKTYYATISFSNLNDPKQFRTLHKGDHVTLKGAPWKTGGEEHITVRELE